MLKRLKELKFLLDYLKCFLLLFWTKTLLILLNLPKKIKNSLLYLSNLINVFSIFEIWYIIKLKIYNYFGISTTKVIEDSFLKNKIKTFNFKIFVILFVYFLVLIFYIVDINLVSFVFIIFFSLIIFVFLKTRINIVFYKRLINYKFFFIANLNKLLLKLKLLKESYDYFTIKKK